MFKWLRIERMKRQAKAGRKYLQNTYLKKIWHPNYTKNSQNSTVRKKKKNYPWHLIEEDIQRANKHGKRCPRCMSPGNHKLKQQGDPNTHLFEWPRSKTLVIPNPCGGTELGGHRRHSLLVTKPAGKFLWKIVCRFLTKLDVLCNPAILLLNINPKELKT